MNKKILFYFLIFYCRAFSSFGQSTYVKQFSIDSLNFGRAVVRTFDGNLMLGGTIVSSAGDTDVVMLKINPAGDTLWTKVIHGSYDEDLVGMVATKDSGFALVAVTQNAFASSLIKTDSAGNVLWAKKFQGLNACYFIQTLDGGYCLCGGGWFPVPGPSSPYSIVVKTNDGGDTAWTRSRHYGINGYSFRQVIQNEDSTYTLAELSVNLDVGTPGLVKLDPQGNFISKTTVYIAPEEFIDVTFCKTTDSEYFFSGDGWGALTNGLQYLKFDPALECIWSKHIDPSPTPLGTYAIIQTQDGNIVLVQAQCVFGQTQHVMKIDTAGNLLWNHLITGFYSRNKNAVVELDDGSLILCGTMSNHLCIVKFDSSGYNCLNSPYLLNIDPFPLGYYQDTMNIEVPQNYNFSADTCISTGTQTIGSIVCQLANASEHEKHPTITLAPNPVTGKVMLRNPNTAFRWITVYNSLGQKVAGVVFDGIQKEVIMDTDGMGAGIYLVEASDTESIWRGKFVKQQ